MEPDDLYGLPLDRFTQERNALARQLRQAGRREEAQAVAKLRKPSLAAWAVNQLVRTQRREIDALFRSGDALQKAQTDLISGRGDPQALRDAVDAERTAVDQLIDRARGLLSGEGDELTPPKLEQVSETLHAAALDEEARTRVRDGSLDRELQHVGLGALSAGGGTPKRTRGRDGSAQAKRDQREQAEARTKQDQRAEAEARRRMERAARDLRSAEERRERAAQNLGEAERALQAAQEAAAEAGHEHERASRRLEESS
jgi:hypothetical protein